MSSNPENEIHCDMPGQHPNTIPLDIAPVTERVDLVPINRTESICGYKNYQSVLRVQLLRHTATNHKSMITLILH